MITISGARLTINDFEKVARFDNLIGISRIAVAKMQRSRKVVENALASRKPAYGLNTGFGKLADRKISSADLLTLQKNLIRSHACGVGAPLSREAIRGIMLLRINALACGYSGIRPQVVQTLVRMLNSGVHPVIPSQGSVGASGDLAQLAHLALVLLGEGKAEFHNRIYSGSVAMKKARISTLVLQPKEGLALINGTQAGASLAALSLIDAQALVLAADIIGAMSIESVKGSAKPFIREISAVRPHPGQIKAAANILRLFKFSQINRSHKNCGKIQEPYSLRCIPQVHGAVRDAISHLKNVLEIEFNSATDNPLVFPDKNEIVAGGNFHGEPLALSLAYFNAAMVELASISERRIALLMDPLFSGLPAFLAKNPGLESGLMMAHVTAAALVSESKILAHPAAIDSIPTSANQEDHVSMSFTASRMSTAIIENVKSVLAIEMIASCAALDFLQPLKPGPVLQKAISLIRQSVPPHHGDRILATDIEKAGKLIGSLSKL